MNVTMYYISLAYLLSGLGCLQSKPAVFIICIPSSYLCVWFYSVYLVPNKWRQRPYLILQWAFVICQIKFTFGKNDWQSNAWSPYWAFLLPLSFLLPTVHSLTGSLPYPGAGVISPPANQWPPQPPARTPLPSPTYTRDSPLVFIHL